VDGLLAGLLPVAGDGNFAGHGQSPDSVERSKHDLGHNYQEVEEEKEHGHDAAGNRRKLERSEEEQEKEE